MRKKTPLSIAIKLGGALKADFSISIRIFRLELAEAAIRDKTWNAQAAAFLAASATGQGHRSKLLASLCLALSAAAPIPWPFQGEPTAKIEIATRWKSPVNNPQEVPRQSEAFKQPPLPASCLGDACLEFSASEIARETYQVEEIHYNAFDPSWIWPLFCSTGSILLLACAATAAGRADEAAEIERTSLALLQWRSLAQERLRAVKRHARLMQVQSLLSKAILPKTKLAPSILSAISKGLRHLKNKRMK